MQQDNNIDYAHFSEKLRQSLAEQEEEFRDTLILNPVENIPRQEILTPATSFLHGLYNTDTVRTVEQKAASKIQFSGRGRITEDVQQIYAHLYCIRPHNAWGWGAADSDPYNLAWEWSSWEEAIEAWHEGVATNTAGLATARTLTAFGEIYASSTSWAPNTAASMRQITP